MKILQVSELAPYPRLGGAPMHAINLGNYFLRQGHIVHFLGNSRHNCAGLREKMDFKGRIIGSDSLNTSIWNGRFEKHCRVYNYPYRVWQAKRIANAINEVSDRYDVIHYHGHFPLVTKYVLDKINFVVSHHDHDICLRKTLLRNDKTLCMPHTKIRHKCYQCYGPGGSFVQKSITRYGCYRWHRMLREAMKKHKHIFVSQRVMDVAMSVLAIDDFRNARVVHNFIDCDRIEKHLEKKSKVKKDRNTVVVLLVAEMNPHKGLEEFLRLFTKMRMPFEIDVVVAGDGRERNKLERTFGGKNVKFVGRLPHPELVRTMKECDIYVLSSIWEESCSTTVLEAIFLGKEIRALRRGGTPELIKYTERESQMRIFDNMESLVESIQAYEQHGRSHGWVNAQFECCVSFKGQEILGFYRAGHHRLMDLAGFGKIRV